MKTRRSPANNLLGLALLLVVVLTGCAKDELVAPAPANGNAKSLNVPMVTDEPANGGTAPGSVKGDGDDPISDDGDDVGDGERNKKKKPN